MLLRSELWTLNGAGNLTEVERTGNNIIITLPGTKFMVTYYKLDDPPELRTKSDWTDDPDAPITLGAFRARAWIAANDKARELGWIW
jgi:hypothetical protein